MKNTRYFLFVGAALCLTVGAFAQGKAAFYRQRDLQLTPVLKLKLESLRAEIKQRGGTFRIAHTSATELPDSKLFGLSNTVLPPSTLRQQNADAVKLLEAERRAVDVALLKDPSLRLKIPLFRLAPTPKLAKWDWRAAGEVTGVRQQLGGTCWAYGPAAAFEASMLVRNNQTVDVSEQYLITNSGAGVINYPPGGDPGKTMTYLVSGGTVSETEVPDTGVQGTPDPARFKPYRAISWGVLADGGKASVAQLKQALCEHGPITTCLNAGGAFGSYGGEGTVINDGLENAGTTHVVLLIGWDDSKQAWLIKNSWGENWGDECGYGTKGGYAWVKYGCRNIGSYSMWVHAYPVFIDFAELTKAFKDLKIDINRIKLVPGIR